MLRITLNASEVVDGKKVLLGTQENFPIPETLEEVLGMEDLDDGCNAEEIVACFVYGWKVKSQAKLRAKAEPTKPASLFRKLTPKDQDALLNLGREQGLIS